ncbi:MAG TPA: type II toxin-antitoxin system VapC family toxin [Thermoanaerobaculia bacterium]|nr:type II toxin-antitoxin system VapC family toxin [Thermoanaerobaculia bacterium]
MRVLLDTHIWIWWLTGGGDLSLAERAALDEGAKKEPPLISAITLWEAQMLHSRGRLKLQTPFESWLLEATAPGVSQVAPLDLTAVLEVDRLPASFHGDPADRIIVATARALNIPLATRDRSIRMSRLVRIWKP